MKSVAGKKMLVTGGAMGMGRAYVERAIADGASDVFIWDMNVEAMEAAKAELETETTKIHIYQVDVTDTELVYKTAEEIVEQFGGIHLLINNAGIVTSAKFADHSVKQIDLGMQINSIAPMHITRAFLPSMEKLDDAHIVNISSGAGFLYCPRITVYCSSKWAIMGWSQALRVELKQFHPHIKVTTVAPGHINTGMFDGAHSALMPAIEVDEMIDAVWTGIKKDKIIVARPRMVGFIPLFRGIFGWAGFDWIAKVTGTNDFMAGHSDDRKKK